MECMGVMAEGGWSSLNGMYTNEEADFMAQLLNSCPLPNELDGSSSFGVPSSFWPCHEATMNMAGINEGSNYASDIANCNLYNISQGSTYSGVSRILFPSSSQESYYLSDSQPIFISNDSSMSINFCMGDATNTSSFLIEADDCLNQELSDGNVEEFGGKQPEHFLPDQNLQPKNFEMPVMEPSIEDISNNPSENPKKRSRGQGDVQKNKRNVKPKKSQKTVSASNNEDDGNAGLNRQALSSCCSEDDSQDLNGGVSSSTSSKGPGALNLNGKTRASRGSATDPQSLYARKRRERINERLRILQNLVPNGTKVDISTMLEEAVQYVKFLQLQIKMLSSDDLWMYAPLAYNGMNLGLDLKITTPNSS